MRRIEELHGMTLVTVEEGMELGRINGVELEDSAGIIRYLSFSGAHGRPPGVVPWEAVRTVGADVVTIVSANQAMDRVPETEQTRLSRYVGDRPLISESGKKLGRVTSYDFNEETGQIAQYRAATDGWLGSLGAKEFTFPHAAVRTFGKDAIIVSDDVAPAEREARAA
ncbi:MAG: PRC-barrel domain-containing protein [Armatimonadota bacterium]